MQVAAVVALVASVAVAAFPPIDRPAAVPVIFVPTKADGVPKFGVTSVGLLANTFAPVPVSSVRAAAKLALVGVAKNVATPVAKPETPVDTGSPVQLVNVPDVGVPNKGVTSVGLVANTFAPVPVSSVKAAAKLALDGVAKNVAMPVANPLTPVDTGRPVQLVKVPDVGVPKRGVTNVGLVDNTLLPEPVEVVTPVPPLVTPNVPVTPVDSGKPVALVNTAAVGVPNAGVTNVGLVARTTEPVPVAVVTPVPPDVTGRAFTNAASVAANNGVTSEVAYVPALVIFTPSLNTIADTEEGIATPVPVAFLIVTVFAVSFCTMYCFSIAGTIKFLAPPVVPVKRKRRLRAVCEPLVSVKVKVISALANVTSAEPVMASLTAVPKLTFVVVPHVPDCSPVVISSILRGE